LISERGKGCGAKTGNKTERKREKRSQISVANHHTQHFDTREGKGGQKQAIKRIERERKGAKSVLPTTTEHFDI
jgi:hypothetical protein